VTEAPAPCAFTLDAASATKDGLAGTGSIVLTASRDTCAWTASSKVSWITLAKSSGTGSVVLSYLVPRNSTGISRLGTVAVADLTFTLTQAALAPPAPPKGLRLATTEARKTEK
jgi:hypothetical protein